MRKIVLVIGCAVLAACTVGPNYKRPTTAIDKEATDTYKAARNGDWQVAKPNDMALRGNWWKVFDDAQLDKLEKQLRAANQTVAAAAASYRQARAAAQATRAGFFPNLTLNASSTRASSGATEKLLGQSAVSTPKTATLDASWEIDLWGRIRREVEAGEANAQASRADYASALLSAQANLAQNYFLLRVTDAQHKLLERTVADYQKSLQLTRNRYNAGVASRADVTQAQAQLQSAQAQAVDIGIERAQLEHAIAILVGKPPVAFTLPPRPLHLKLPSIPLVLPSALLERRPDIAAAERRVAAANAQIGVQRAAYFPTLGISASGGYQSQSFSQWFTAPNRFWSIGPTLSLSLFDAGLRAAQNREAVAAYDQTVANYRQTVLSSLQEVEDNLAALDRLKREVKYQRGAVASSREALRMVENQYKAGTVSFLSVLSAETTAYTNERTLLQAQGRQFSASVLLIKALGGGWNAKRLQH